MNKLRFVCMTTLPLALCALPLFADTYTQTNLVSDLTTEGAAFVDPNLKDPWGVAFSPTSPIWVSDRATGLATLYNGAGMPQALVVTVPPGAPNGPTGQVFAGGTSFGATFIFDTLNTAGPTGSSTIQAWSGGTAAAVKATTVGANYTGLAIANNTLFAANFAAAGGINVFDSTFTATTLPGKFVDPNLPSGYAPFNIQAVGSTLYVEYAQVTSGVPVAVAGGGYVDEFDTNGNFVKRLAGNSQGAGPLSGPWGLAVVPAGGYGSFAAGDVLVGNFVSGDIDVFDANGNFLQTLNGANGNPLVNSGLWAIAFDPGAPGTTDAKALYFTAGLNQGADGLFGKIDAVPEPAAWSLVILGVVGLAVVRRRHRKNAISA